MKPIHTRVARRSFIDRSPIDLRSSAAIACLFGLAIVVAAAFYLLLHPVTYRSDAELAVAPRSSGFRSSTVISTVDSSGAVGTYAEILAATDPKDLGFRQVTTKVRTVPASRAIQITAESKSKGAVRPALEKILRTVSVRESALPDLWTLNAIRAPSEAGRASVDARFVMSGAVLTALFGATMLYILLQILRDPATYRSTRAPLRGRRPGGGVPPVPPGYPSSR